MRRRGFGVHQLMLRSRDSTLTSLPKWTVFLVWGLFGSVRVGSRMGMVRGGGGPERCGEVHDGVGRSRFGAGWKDQCGELRSGVGSSGVARGGRPRKPLKSTTSGPIRRGFTEDFPKRASSRRAVPEHSSVESESLTRKL